MRGDTMYECFHCGCRFLYTPPYEGRRSFPPLTSAIGVSIHSPRMRGDGYAVKAASGCKFLYTPFVWGETIYIVVLDAEPLISIHSPLVWGRHRCTTLLQGSSNFYTLPSYERRHYGMWKTPVLRFLYTPLVWGETIHTPTTLTDAARFYTLSLV